MSDRRRPEDEEVVGSPNTLNSLEEVEQALSKLDGRHQNTVRVQRQTQEAIAAKRAAYEEEERRADSAERRGRILRVFLVVVLVAALGGGGIYGYLYYGRSTQAEAALARRTAPFLAAGWSALPAGSLTVRARSALRRRSQQEVSVGADTCILAVASAEGGKVTVERSSGSFSAEGSAAWCTCGDEHAIVRSADQAGAVQVLTQGARIIGGNGALPFLVPRPATLPAIEACPMDPLDAWLAAGHGVSPMNDSEIAASVRDVLKDRGFSLVASAPSQVPFAVVPAVADSCFVATSSAAGEELSLRVALGQRPLHIAPGTSLGMGWCTQLPMAATVFRIGNGTVAVYRAAAAKVPGTFGLREVATRAGLGDVPTWVSRGERGWDASAPLIVSGIYPNDITVATNVRAITQARVVALTLEGGRVVPDPDEADRYRCSPTLDGHARGAICVQSSPLAWRTVSGEPAGIAESPLPFWMDVLTNVEGTEGLNIELALLSLSRRLAREGYEATARDGVSEEANGVTVVGRPGDDRIIAIGLTRVSPWVIAYSEGAPWGLDGEPHSIPLAGGQEIHLTTRPWLRIPVDSRRTVVFRHRASASGRRGN